MAKRTRAEIKAALMRQFEAELEALLDWEEATDRPSLRQIEEVILGCRHRLGEVMAEAVIENQETVQPAPRVLCPQCGQEMRGKGQKKRVIDTMVGDLDVTRSYHYCPRCQRGLFPPR